MLGNPIVRFNLVQVFIFAAAPGCGPTAGRNSMNYRLRLLAAAVVLASLDAGYALSAEPSGELAHVIQVEGHGDVWTSPDIAMLTMTIESNAATADRADSLNAATTKHVLDAVSEKLGGKGRVDTAGYSLNPVYSNEVGPRPSNYGCSTRFMIRTDSRDLVPDLLDKIQNASGGVVSAQANNGGPNQSIEIRFSADSRAFTASDCKEVNAKLIRKLMDPLKAKLGSHGRIEEAGFTIEPEVPPGVPNYTPQLIGYRAENSLVVETSSFNVIGPIIDTAVGAGATQLGQLTFALRDDKKARSDALVAAANDAQLRAQTVARAMGVKIKRLLKIIVIGEIQPEAQPYSMVKNPSVLPRAAVSTPIKPGQVMVSATITVLYDLE
jgi:uncharacterized protein